MDEARIRIYAVRRFIEERETWAPRLLQDFCYLQFRMICEQIATGCLVAHGDIPDKGALKQWKIPAVMETMQKLKENFYPKPVRFSGRPGGLHLEDYNAPHLTKGELVSLWVRSGNMLHRGTAKTLLSQYGKPLIVDVHAFGIVFIACVAAPRCLPFLNGYRHVSPHPSYK